MVWTIEYSDSAMKQLKKMDKKIFKKIDDYLQTRIVPSVNPRKVAKQLCGMYGEYWRFRVGDYRIICNILQERFIVVVLKIGHRKEVYEA